MLLEREHNQLLWTVHHHHMWHKSLVHVGYHGSDSNPGPQEESRSVNQASRQTWRSAGAELGPFSIEKVQLNFWPGV